MDVNTILAREPASSARLQRWLEVVRARLAPAQLAAMERWGNTAPFAAGAQAAFRDGQVDVTTLMNVAHQLGRAPRDRAWLAERTGELPRVFEAARERPAVASALVWNWLGEAEPQLASNLVQAIRERAGLPGLRRRLEVAEAPSAVDVAWFGDRQVEDAAAWLEHVPAPHAATLSATIAAIEAQRAAVATPITELAPFLRQVASFVVLLSTRALDPLGFPLSRDVSLVLDPPLAQRVELASWARSVQRAPCLRGQMIVMTLAVAAPWPLALEVIASELGSGTSGAFGVVMRLRAEVALPPGPQVPLLLCVPGEPIEERGARFERWSQRAYPHAVDAWRAWC